MAELIISKEIFNLKAVKESAKAFENLCQISITDTTSTLLCTFKMKVDIPVADTINEFENYLINLTVSGGFYEDN